MRVLIVDDDSSVRVLARHVVEALGHTCIDVGSGHEAWELFVREEPHVVITDLLMPGMDGLSLCRAIRSTSKGQAVYIVVLTSLSTPAQALEAVEAGADDFLVKPLEPFVMQMRMRVAARVTGVHKELREHRRELKRLADTDSLTGLYNRRRLEHDLTRLHETAERYSHAYALALLDLDHFKTFNDARGHVAGDEALRIVASVLKAERRQVDTVYRVYRYGGEEFVMLLPYTDIPGATVALERIRGAVAEASVGEGQVRLSVSVGIAGLSGAGDIRTPTSVLEQADRMLYAAKAAGRNRVVAAVADQT